MTERFADRFALTSFDDGALLVDLVGGDIHETNAAAAAIWARLIEAGDVEYVVHALAGQWNVSREALRRDIEAMVSSIEPTGIAHESSDRLESSMLWSRDERGDVLEVCGIPCARVAGGGQIELLEGAARAGASTTLVWVAPHVLMAQGCYVLHASGVRLVDQTVHAFVGASGAGKTTTARAIAAACGECVSEDLVVTSACDGDARCDVWTEGEARIREWARTSATSGRDVVEANDLGARVCAGRRSTLKRVVFLDPVRRQGSRFVLCRVGATRACVALLANGFAERGSEATWRTAVAGSSAIARRVTVVDAGVPHGLDALERAAAGYSTISIS